MLYIRIYQHIQAFSDIFIKVIIIKILWKCISFQILYYIFLVYLTK